MHSTREIPVVVPAGRSCVLEERLPDYDPQRGVYVVLPDSNQVEFALLRRTDIRRMAIHGRVNVLSYEDQGQDLVVTVQAETYTHGVYFEGDLPCSDQYFDLLPGQEKTVTLFGRSGQRPAPKWVK